MTANSRVRREASILGVSAWHRGASRRRARRAPAVRFRARLNVSSDRAPAASPRWASLVAKGRPARASSAVDHGGVSAPSCSTQPIEIGQRLRPRASASGERRCGVTCCSHPFDRLFQLGSCRAEFERRAGRRPGRRSVSPRRWWISARPRMAARLSGALATTTDSRRGHHRAGQSPSERPSQRDRARQIARVARQPGLADVRCASSLPRARRSSSPSWAKAMEDGSVWTRRRSSEIVHCRCAPGSPC